jgi:exopolysaccharide production protein ExoZ
LQNSKAITESRPMLVNLHFLRFLAALPVLAYHTAEHVWASGVAKEGWLYAIYLVGFGGVDVFFVISGFIIWHTTHEENGPVAASRFLRRRIARTYSGYWPFLLSALFLLYLYYPQLLAQKDWLLSSFLIPNPAATTRQLLPGRLALPVAWTLIYEVYFYLVFGLLIAFRRQANIGAIAVAVVVVVLAGLYAVYTGVFALDRLLESSLLFTFYLSPYWLEFLAGCLLGEYYRRHTIRWPLAWLLFGLLMTFVIGWVNARWFDGRMNMGYYVPIRVLLFIAAAVGYVLWALGLDQKGKNFLPRTCLILGGSTYALYLSHTFWLRWLYDIGVRDWLQQNDLTIAGYLIASLYIIAISAVYYQFAERRLHSGFRRLLGVGKKRMGSESSARVN